MEPESGNGEQIRQLQRNCLAQESRPDWAAKALGGAGNTSQYMQTELGFSSSFTIFELVYTDRFCFPTFSLSCLYRTV